MKDYAYFIPGQGTFGDLKAGNKLQRVYQNTGLSEKYCGKFNGISTWVRDDGTEVVRLIALDFFNDEKACYIVKDLI
jgi:hypothetical protein